MRVKVIPKGLVKRECFKNLEKKFLVFEIEDKISVEDFLKILNIPKGYVSVISINRKRADMKTIILDKDTISLWPPVAGG
jgi:molybdopterin converting factor small subunit